jgi:hypothetical protein
MDQSEKKEVPQTQGAAGPKVQPNQGNIPLGEKKPLPPGSPLQGVLNQKPIDKSPQKSETQARTEGVLAGLAGAGAVAAIAIGMNSANGEESSVDLESIAQLPISDVVTNDMAFEEAWLAAREDVGPDGAFVWNGQMYSTHNNEEVQAMNLETADWLTLLEEVPEAPVEPEKEHHHSRHDNVVAVTPTVKPEPEPEPVKPEPHTIIEDPQTVAEVKHNHEETIFGGSLAGATIGGDSGEMAIQYETGSSPSDNIASNLDGNDLGMPSDI